MSSIIVRKTAQTSVAQPPKTQQQPLQQQTSTAAVATTTTQRRNVRPSAAAAIVASAAATTTMDNVVETQHPRQKKTTRVSATTEISYPDDSSLFEGEEPIVKSTMKRKAKSVAIADTTIVETTATTATTTGKKPTRAAAAAKREELAAQLVTEYGKAALHVVDGRPPMYPEFMRLAEIPTLEDNFYWRQLLREFAYGIFPSRRFLYDRDQGLLVFRPVTAKRPSTTSTAKKKTDLPQVKIEEGMRRSPEMLLEEIKRFVERQTGRISGNEMNERLREEEERRRLRIVSYQHSFPRSWKEIDRRKTSLRNKLLCEFIERLSHDLGLDPHQRLRLCDFIFLCVQLELITDDDIILENQRIVSVRNITCDMADLSLERTVQMAAHAFGCNNVNVDSQENVADEDPSSSAAATTTTTRKRRTVKTVSIAPSVAGSDDNLYMPSLDNKKSSGATNIDDTWKKYVGSLCKAALRNGGKHAVLEGTTAISSTDADETASMVTSASGRTRMTTTTSTIASK
jgi:hypothetical protein